MNEVYRMPSIGAIQALVTQRSLHETMKKKQESLASQFQRRVVANEHSLACVPDVPSINPYDAYFLLNPSGDLESTQAAFEEMFKSQHGWEVGFFCDSLERGVLFKSVSFVFLSKPGLLRAGVAS